MDPGALDRKRNFPQVGSNGIATVIKAKGIGKNFPYPKRERQFCLSKVVPRELALSSFMDGRAFLLQKIYIRRLRL
jgi:hypothetical protein